MSELNLTDIGIGAAPNDGTGDTPRTAGAAINANNAAIEGAVNALQGRFWTTQNASTTAALGDRLKANNHAGITITMPAAFAASATDYSDLWVCNADDASNVTLTPASGDAFFVDGATHGIDTTYALTPGNLAILSPRTTDSEWDLILVGGAAGGGSVATDAIWDAAGDLAVGSGADTAARLAIGTGLQVLRVNAGATGLEWAAAGGGWDVEDTTNGNYGHGLNALDSLTPGSGLDNIAIGENAGTALTTGDQNTLMGTGAGRLLNVTARNVAIGHEALYNSQHNDSVAIGWHALYSEGSQGSNTAVGSQALANQNGGSGNIGIGDAAGSSITGGDSNIHIGSGMSSYTTGSNGIFIGGGITPLNTNDRGQIVIGDATSQFIIGHMGAKTDVDYSAKYVTITGTSALPTATVNLSAGDLILQGGVAATTGAGVGGDLILQGGAGGSTGTKGSVILDYATWPAADGTADYVLKTDGAGNLSWVAQSGGGFTSIVDDETNGNYAIGLNALDSVTPGSGLDNIAIGENAGTLITTGDFNICIGTDSEVTATSSNNVVVGYDARVNSAGSSVAIGSAVGQSFGLGQNCVGVGYGALRSNTSDPGNTAVGAYAMYNDSTSVSATAIGANAGYSGGTKTDSVLLGNKAAYNTSATYSYVRAIVIGNEALNQTTAQQQDAIAIGTNCGDGTAYGYGVHFGNFCSPVRDYGLRYQHNYTSTNLPQPWVDGRLPAWSDTDVSSNNITYTGCSAFPTATVNLNAGDLILQGGIAATTGAGVGGDVKLQGGAGGSTGTKGSVILDYATWPAADGTADYVLKTDGAGNLSWVAQPGGFTSIVDDETNGNYAIGLNALDSVTLGSGLDNIAIGENAATALTTSDNCIAIGTGALGSYSGTGGTGCIAIGTNALGNATTAGGFLYNVAIGFEAGQSITGNDAVTAVGYQAAKSNLSGGLTAIGAYACTGGNGSNSVAVGENALKSGGTNCVAVGAGAMQATGGVGTGNVAIGQGALSSVTTAGSYNVGIGVGAGDNGTTVNRSIIIGGLADFPSATDSDQIQVQQYLSTTPFITGYLGASSDIDHSAKSLTITGSSAFPGASTNLSAGDLILQGGVAATTGAGVGGDLILKGGAGGSTGTAGKVIVQTDMVGQPASLVVKLGDETSDMSVGDNKVQFPMPYDMTVSEVFIVVNTAPTGANAIFDITESGTTILSTLVSIDATETSSLTAATPPVISDSTLTKGNVIGVNIDQIGSTVAGAGATLVINGVRA